VGGGELGAKAVVVGQHLRELLQDVVELLSELLHFGQECGRRGVYRGWRWG
jgi:hypothetical protein